ncbi:hypothetical protein [Rathayibacter sp. AY1B7]|nr:hypothetical protein [Rathayibacter sp. AY1B7]
MPTPLLDSSTPGEHRPMRAVRTAERDPSRSVANGPSPRGGRAARDG